LKAAPACAKQHGIFTPALHLLSGSPQGARKMTTGTTMANEGEDSGDRRNPHRGTFEGFITATKWGVALISLTLILMAIFLV